MESTLQKVLNSWVVPVGGDDINNRKVKSQDDLYKLTHDHLTKNSGHSYIDNGGAYSKHNDTFKNNTWLLENYLLYYVYINLNVKEELLWDCK